MFCCIDKNPPPTVLPVLPNDVSVINPATGLQHPIMIMNNAAQVSMPLHATKIKSRKGKNANTVEPLV